jgi:enoyl-CoA hydratase/carnithine racemase
MSGSSTPDDVTLPQPGSVTHAVFQSDGELGIIEFHSEPQNRLSRRLFEKLDGVISEASRSGVRALLVRSTGPDFSRGGDFREWPSLTSHLARRDRFGYSNSVLAQLERLPFPTIAAVQGAAWGGGFEVALRADLIVAAQSATFRFPEATIAVHPLAGGVQRVAERAGRAVASRIVMTSEIVDAEAAFAMGLIGCVVSDEDLQTRSEQIARSLAAGPTRAHAATKLLLDAWAAGGVAAADAQMVELNATILGTSDVAEGVSAATVALEGGTNRPTTTFKGR